MSAATYTIIDTTSSNQEESIKLTEPVARGLADGYAFNYLEAMSPDLRASNQQITVILPQIKDDTTNSWIQNGSATIKDLITSMKEDEQIINDTQVTLKSEGAGRPRTVDSAKHGGALLDIPTTLTVIIRGIAECTEGGFDTKRYNSEIDIFANRLAMRIKQGGYSDVVTVAKLRFTDIKEVDLSEL